MEGPLKRLILTHRFNEVTDYCRTNNISPDFEKIMDELIKDNCYAAVEFAKYGTTVALEFEAPLLDINLVTQQFITHKRI